MPDQTMGGEAMLSLSGRRVHFVGAGGCGMSGLARLARDAGATCTGSDVRESDTVQALSREGMEIVLEQNAASVPPGTELLVTSAAIGPTHPEVIEASRRGVPVLKYAQMLGRLMRTRTGVAIAGTHGKSSTTSLLAHILLEAGLDPSFIVGAQCRQIGGGSRSGGSDILLAEACEYDRSFHNFHPRHAAILNVEADHLDLYASLAEIEQAFAVFARQVQPDGSLLIQHELTSRPDITDNLACRVETLGFDPASDWVVALQGSQIRNQKSEIKNSPTVSLHHHGEQVACWHPPLPGSHMAYNAAAAAVLAHRLGAHWQAIGRAIETFAGLDRRMQPLGQRDGVRVVDDYGHHPTEIQATLDALRQHHRPARLICVFQPHQHSRTRFLLERFAESFSQADIVIVPEIYFVRDSEQERHAVTAGDLVERLRDVGVRAMHVHPFEAIVEQLEQVAADGDLLVTMGAGDVWRIARDYLERAHG